MKKINIFLLWAVVTLVFAVQALGSYNYSISWYYNSTPVTNLRTMVYACNNALCDNPLGTLKLNSSLLSNNITISYPVPSDTIYGYATYFFSTCLKYQEMNFNVSQNIDVNYGAANFGKSVNCTSPFNNFSATNTTYENQTIFLTATLPSAFFEAPISPWGEPSDADIVKDYLSGQTNVSFYVNNSLGNIVYNETRELYILEDTNTSISFNWTPDFTQSGNYTLILISRVPDCKCINDIPDRKVITLSVYNTNRAPIAVDDYYSVYEDNVLNVTTSSGILLNDSDPDGDSLFAFLVNTTKNGVLALSLDGTFVYTPAANFNGNDNFTYYVSDGNSNSSIATAYIIVIPLNDAPIAYNVSKNTTKNTPISINLNCSDADNSSLNYFYGSPSNGAASFLNVGSVNYTPNNNYVGSDSFLYNCSDGINLSNNAFVFINIADYCENNLTYTAWSDWANVSCLLNNTLNQSRTRVQYDINNCGNFSNITYTEYQLDGYCNGSCNANITDTSISAPWVNVSCLINNSLNQSRIVTQYDANYCGWFSNISYVEYRIDGYCNGSCNPILTNSTWSSWANVSCLINNTMNQSRTRVQYDSNYCGWVPSINFTEYQLDGYCNYSDYCTPNLVNTSWSNWVNVSCLLNNTLNQSRTRVQYDANYCGTVSNVTFVEYQLDGYCNSSCTPNIINVSSNPWLNISCLIDDTMNQSRIATRYDANYCGWFANVSFVEYRHNETCDYCQPNVINSSWSSWQNQGSCIANNTQLQNRSLTEYDSNYATCYAVTGLPSDLWNLGNNITFWQNQYIGCDYCTPYLANTSKILSNIACLSTNIMNQSLTWTEYDSNFCNEVANQTFIEYIYNQTCDYNLPPYFTTTPVKEAYPEIDYTYSCSAADPDGDNLSYSLIYGPSSMSFNGGSSCSIYWKPGFNDEGNCYLVRIMTTDHYYNTTQDYNLCVKMPSSEIYPRRKIYIENIRMNNEVYDYVRPCEDLYIDVSFENWGVYDIKKSTIRVTVPELGISTKIGPFGWAEGDEEMLKRIPLVIPVDAEPGVYTLRMTLVTDNQIRRVRHRDFRVVLD